MSAFCFCPDPNTKTVIPWPQYARAMLEVDYSRKDNPKAWMAELLGYGGWHCSHICHNFWRADPFNVTLELINLARKHCAQAGKCSGHGDALPCGLELQRKVDALGPLVAKECKEEKSFIDIKLTCSAGRIVPQS